MLHEAARAVLLPKPETPTLPCAFSSCHTDKIKKAQLVLDTTVTDLRATLVGKAACEAPNLKLVDATGGDAGLAKSWLWIKLAATGEMIPPDPSWGTPGSCGQMGAMDYGVRMPYGGGMWEDTKLAAVKAWICAGAPGPM